MPSLRVVSKPYSYPPSRTLGRDLGGIPLIKVRVSIHNPRSGSMTSFDEICWLDTGFDGDVFVPESHVSDARIAGVTPSMARIRLADGTLAISKLCLGYIASIDGFTFPSPGIEVQLYMRGSPPYGLLGLGVLKNWVTKLDGPNQFFDVYC